MIEFDYQQPQSLSQWSLGFYMPRTFDKLVNLSTNTRINPNLMMQICQGTRCVPLKYIKRSDNDFVYSDGYANVLQPTEPFTLEPGQHYTIQLFNNNQWSPNNLVSMPQSFFLTDLATDKITPITVPLSAYGNKLNGIGGYNAIRVNDQINFTTEQQWLHSQPITNQIEINRLGLVPAPSHISALNLNEQLPLHGKNVRYQSTFDTVFNRQFFQNVFDAHITANATTLITIEKDNNLPSPEAYTLNVNADGVTIQAKTKAGVFYAMESLRQINYLHQGLPYLTLSDSPSFPYRGLMIDTARHFESLPELKTIINAMAALKLNTLHLHLSDDEGWRLALPVIPTDQLNRATSRGYFKGSVNPAAVFLQSNLDIANHKNFAPNGALLKAHYANATSDYSHYYTEQQIKALIHYANERQITVIPEIDIPGHSEALIHSAPNIYVNKQDHSQYISVEGYYDDVLPVCLYDKTGTQAQAFTDQINGILKDIHRLFNDQTTVYAENQVVSIGGDEVPTNAWSKDANCQHPMTALNREQKFLTELQKNNPSIRVSGWQQFVQQDNGKIGQYAAPANHVGYIWVWNLSNQAGMKNAVELATHHYPTVLDYANHTYFDLTYAPTPWAPGFYWAGNYLNTYSALTSSQAVQHTLEQTPPVDRQYIKGLEGTLWTENVTTARTAEYKLFPKVTGLAEASWSSPSITDQHNQPDWQSLAHRLVGISNNHGLLGYLQHIDHIVYRGMQNNLSGHRQ
jgi:hexosaminidase